MPPTHVSTLIGRYLPETAKQFARRIRFAGNNRYCPICERSAGSFLPFGMGGTPRQEAQCPFCFSLERHRLIWLFFRDHTNLFRTPWKRMLHVAPEPSLSGKLQISEFIDYLSADLSSPEAMVRMDITDIHYPDDTFDVIYCSHVLEHVPDDRKAMRELRRVLTPAGWAVLQVPFSAPKTFEDPSITDPAERERVFGQWDHVRRYGPDYEDRLVEAGFRVTKIKATDVAAPEEIDRMRLFPRETIFLCHKH